MAASSDNEATSWKPDVLVDDEEPEKDHGYDYDLIVIGGGSGGIACAKEAARLGATVAILDYIEPSPQGTSWGLGGTCVNVGCIPKKLMHICGQFGDVIKDAKEYGWDTAEEPKHNWETMVNLVQDYIHGLNFAYVKDFRKKENTTYFNAKGTMVDKHTVHMFHPGPSKRKAVDKQISGRRIVVAVGGRPRYPNIPGAKELCISSDDIFSMEKAPGKTLVIGASYVALECGGFVHALGYPVSIMVRSIYLRGYDQDIANQIGSFMEEIGVKMIRPAIPTSMEKTEDGRILVKYNKTTISGKTRTDEEVFDTVLLAIGRDLVTPQLNLDKAGVVMQRGGYIDAVNERSSVPHIYAIGDVLAGRPQLTPVAIQAGKMLAKRLYGGSKHTMDYNLVPTTVFTPLEYGTVGISEEEAIKRHGEDVIEVYHAYYEPLAWSPLQDRTDRPKGACYLKLVCDRANDEKVLGLHVLGLNAGEITQGYAVALRLGATKGQFDETVGIHPTAAESFHTLKYTKRSGFDVKSLAGCAT